jgi:hypothetical protein
MSLLRMPTRLFNLDPDPDLDYTSSFVTSDMATSRTQAGFVCEGELSQIGRRRVKQGRQFATARRIVVAARKVFAQREHGLFQTEARSTVERT